MQQLSRPERDVIARVNTAPMLDQVLAWSAINTGTGNLEGLARQWDALAAAFSALPGTVNAVRADKVAAVAPDGSEREIANGAHLVLRVRPDAPRRFLLTGHMDTVFPPAHAFQHTGWKEASILNGPGVADMKGGIAVILAALTAFEGSDAAAGIGYDVMINSDEET
ncbi:MAG: M20/M25/M40 family metallo-hydrolase, partial [Sphingomonadales bacterium]|nr:M20/M25/M40 family metallo-hydrolase [Sphingomonadales bacterium]